MKFSSFNADSPAGIGYTDVLHEGLERASRLPHVHNGVRWGSHLLGGSEQAYRDKVRALAPAWTRRAPPPRRVEVGSRCGNPAEGAQVSEQEHVQASKQAYEAFGKGDLEAVFEAVDDDVEWIVPGESAVSGTYRGKDEVQGFFGKLAEKGFETHPEHWLADGELVVTLTHWKMEGGECDAADVGTWRDGKIVKFQSAGDTALFERVFGKG